MMWIFFIDWQQHWKCDWTMNIGANRNAHGKRTVSTKQPQVKKWKTWQLDFQTLERYWASFQVTRLLHSAITRIKSCFFFFFFFFLKGGGGGGGGGSSNAFTIWCCILISRPPRVIRRFKRRSCLWMKRFLFWLKFLWRLFLRVQLAITQHWLR